MMTTEQMQAAQFRRFGDPDVLEMVTVPRPTPGAGEVQVRVHASTVNPHDTFVRDGTMKMLTGRKFPMGVGLDFAGEIVAAGTEVADIAIGSQVWGMVSPKGAHVTGSAAEYVVVPSTRVALFPEQLSMVEAASLVTSGTTALRAIRDVAQTRPGEKVLVRGAAGGVGMIVVQLAHALGAQVTALASGSDADFVTRCGADEVLDFRAVDADGVGTFDVIVDTVGRGMLAFRRRLNRQGRMVTISFGSPRAMGAIAVSKLFGARRIRTFSSNPDSRLLTDLAEYVTSGAVQPIVDTVYPLQRIADAHAALFTPGRHGKLVLTTTR